MHRCLTRLSWKVMGLLLLLGAQLGAQPQPVWLNDADEAIIRAVADQRPALLFVHDPSSAWSNRFELEVLHSALVRDRLAGFSLARINLSEDSATVQRYRVRGAPTLLLFDPDGRLLDRHEGFVPVEALLPFLAPSLSYRAEATGLFRPDFSRPETVNWRALVLRLGNRGERDTMVQALLKQDPFPAEPLVALLSDRRLAVRLGALDVLERASGDDFGFDPWLSPGVQTKSLERWQHWSGSNTDPVTTKAAPITEQQANLYLTELFSEDRVRSRRAFDALRPGGLPIARYLRDYVANHPDLDESRRRILRELQYAIILAELDAPRPDRLARQLVYGHAQERVEALRTIADKGSGASSVMLDYLGDGDNLVREAAVEALGSTAGDAAIPHYETLLLREGDREVIITTLNTLAKLPRRAGRDMIVRFLHDSDEDIVVAALRGLTLIGLSQETDNLRQALQDPRWRVRVAAIEAMAASRNAAFLDDLLEQLTDQDSFVRTTAANAIAQVGGRGSINRLSTAFVEIPESREALAASFRSMNLSWTPAMRELALEEDPEQLIVYLTDYRPRESPEWLWLETLAASDNRDLALFVRQIIVRHGFGSPERLRLVASLFDTEDEEAAALLFEHYNPNELRRLLENAQTEISAPSPAPAASRSSRGGLLGILRRSNPEAPTPSGLIASLDALSGIAEHWQSAGSTEALRNNALLFLAISGDDSAAGQLLEKWEQMSLRQQTVAADALRGQTGTAFVQLGKRMLESTQREVREKAVYSMRESIQDPVWLDVYFQTLLADNTELSPADAYFSSFRNVENNAPLMREYLMTLLKQSQSPDHVAAALDWWASVWDDEVLPEVKPYLSHRDTALRRAAWTLLLRINLQRNTLHQLDVTALLEDPVPSIRALYPRFQRPGGFSIQLELPSGARRHDYQMNMFGRRQALPDQARDQLLALLDDPSPMVAAEAVVALYANGQKIDPNRAVALIERAKTDEDDGFERGPHAMALAMVEHPRIFGPEDTPLAPYLDEISYSEDKVRDIRRRMRILASPRAGVAAAPSASPDLLTQGLLADATPLRRESIPAIDAPASPESNPQDTPAGPSFTVIFFTQAGCPECRQTHEDLNRLATAFPGMEVKAFDVREIPSLRLHEALSEQYNVPERFRLTAPAIFTETGFLTRDTLSFQTLAALLESSERAPGEAWFALPDEVLTASGERIEERLTSLTLWIVIGAGLLDGLNPCAFATIIFFLSYLQVARRTPIQILQVGLAYVTGILITYFAVGFGFIHVLARLTVVQSIATAVNWLMALAVLIICILSIRDGILCLQGKLKETTLQLPKALKKRVNTVIRTGMKHSRFVLAAFVTGVIIAILELACTGQVYAPTIAYVIQSGADRATALGYLLIYNLAFILPLLLVMILAYRGLTSERLRVLFEKHVALVKWGNAALFAILFIFFLVVLL